MIAVARPRKEEAPFRRRWRRVRRGRSRLCDNIFEVVDDGTEGNFLAGRHWEGSTNGRGDFSNARS